MQNPQLTVLHSLLCILIIILGFILLGCTHEGAVPPVSPPPEDLSTWTVPELVQPPPSETPGAPGEAKPTAAEKVYAYMVGTPYQVQVSVGWPLDVVLEHGEQVRNIVGGDRSDNDTRIPQPPRPPAGAQGEGQTTVPSDTPTPAPTNARRLEVREGSEGMGETLRPHIFVSTSEAGIRAGMVITTSKRAYLLDIKSVKISPVRIVRWTYPTGTSIPTGKPKELGILPDPDAVTRYHVGYVLQHQGRAPDWMPRGAGSIVDDGKKLYVLLPITTLYTTAPMVRALGVQGARLVNVRAYLNVLIIDELAERLELRVGTGESAEVVTITRGEIHTIECPTSAECPHWPPAAQTLARRQP